MKSLMRIDLFHQTISSAFPFFFFFFFFFSIVLVLPLFNTQSTILVSASASASDSPHPHRLLDLITSHDEKHDPFHFADMTAWITASDGYFADELVSLQVIDEKIGRGMLSLQDIPAGAVIMEIPSSLMFTEAAALQSLQITKDILGIAEDVMYDEEEAVDHLFQMPLTNAMALLLLSHLKMDQLSPFYPFFRSLPRSPVPSTLNFPEEDLAEHG